MGVAVALAHRSRCPRLAEARRSVRRGRSRATDCVWLCMTSNDRLGSRARVVSGHVRPRVPTSAVLARLLAEAPPDYVSLAWLVDRLQARSFGLVMLLLALVSLLPGAGILAGILLAFPAVQMMLGRESPSIPRFLASRRIPTRHIAGLAARAVPLLERLEAVIRPRLPTPFEATKRLTGLIVLLLAATFVLPVPFSQIIPALVIMLMSFAYLEEDGVLMGISLVAAVVSLAVTAATIWATLSAAGLVEKLWTGT